MRNLLMAWVLTLPVSILLAGGLYFVFAKVFWTPVLRRLLDLRPSWPQDRQNRCLKGGRHG